MDGVLTSQLGHIVQQDGRHRGRVGDCTLDSAFQPILSPALMRVVGTEALLRVQGLAGAMPPMDFFASLSGVPATDTCHFVRKLHLLNAPSLPQGNEWLFLNVHPETIQRRVPPAAFVAELSSLGLTPLRIVLDVADGAGVSDAALREFVTGYQGAGFRIAIDDFGAGVSNYDRVISIEPDIIRLDRSLIANASVSARARRLLPHIASLLREAGALILVEGIETAEQARIALEIDAELVQGWYFGKPVTGAPDIGACHDLVRAVVTSPNGASASRRSDVEAYRGRFLDVWTAFRDGKSLEQIARELREKPITRLYVIDNAGFQLGDTALTAAARRDKSHPLSDASGACWAHRPYFRRAMEQPGRIQVTRPYLSLTEQRLCVTFSCATSRPGYGQCVVCMDVLVDA